MTRRSSGWRARGAGPTTLLVPILLGVLAALFWQEWRRDAGEPLGHLAEPAVEVSVYEASDVAGWKLARLAPLHADTRRQSFDAEAIHRRLGWNAGELWRLTLVRDPDANPAEVTTFRFDPADLRVEDEAGGVLRPMNGGLDEIADGALPADPLALLLKARPFVPDGPGAEVQVVLWGPAPTGTPRLLGIEGSAGGAPSSVALEPRRLPVRELPRWVARLDALVPPEAAPESD